MDNIPLLTKGTSFNWYMANKGCAISHYWHCFSTEYDIPERTCNPKSFSVKIICLGRNVHSLRGEKKKQYLAESFVLPQEAKSAVTCSQNKAVLKQENVELRKERVTLKRKIAVIGNLEEGVWQLSKVKLLMIKNLVD